MLAGPLLNIKLTTILMVVNNSFFDFIIEYVPVDVRVEGRTVLGSELVGIVAAILKGHNIFIRREEILKSNAGALNGRISAEVTLREIVGNDDVNAHCEVPFRFFLYIL